jgi:DNA-binding SARP family transcriptional activator
VVEPDAARTDVLVELRLLDGFRLVRDGRDLALPLYSQRLVAFLALKELPLARVYVAGALWLDASQEQANANLRTTLWRIRKANAVVVVSSPTHVALAPTVRVDVHAVTTAARRVLAGTADRGEIRILADAGELLPDWYDDWLIVERESLRQFRLRALEALAVDALECGNPQRAVDAALAAVVAEPLRETAHRLLIEAHLAAGNRADALTQFRLYTRLDVTQLAAEPSPQIAALVRGLGRRGGDDGALTAE